VVVATVALVDEQGSCMNNGFAVRIQSSPDIVELGIMRSISKALTIHFSKHTRKFPKKVLVFRDGSSEGNFPSLDAEITGIRESFSDAWKEIFSGDLPSPPALSFVVCVNNHNVQIVPSKGAALSGNDARQRGRPANVPSGTCVNEVIMPFSEMNVGSDFLLTAQGGLKGTSKPVFYRPLLLDERAGLTRDVLQHIAFVLSFHYGTATKATRRLSVAQYSKRLAEQFLAFLPCKQPPLSIACLLFDRNYAKKCFAVDC